MTDRSDKLRLDEILLREGLISQEQINEALMRQKAHGGKIGSQLLYHRYLDEPSLVKALALQFGCEGVVLTGLEIPAQVIAMIPTKVAVARKALPFVYDRKAKVLSIACPDPTDSALQDELRFVIKDKTLKFYVAAELSLETAIARYYEGREITLEDNLLLEIPDEATGGVPADGPMPAAAEPSQDRSAPRGEILLVTDDAQASPILQSLLERDGFHVTVTSSADDAIEMLGDISYHTVFIKDTVPGDYIDLIDRLRKSSPKTAVRYYESVSSLVLEQEQDRTEADLLTRNLELFTALLSFREKLPTNHSGAVGQYVDKLCRKLGLPAMVRLQVVCAGYLHDLARYYYHLNERQDPREVVKLTAKLLGTINHSPVVTEMMRSMYINLGGKYTKRLPIEVLGGNILTIVDLYCENVDVNEKLALDKFEVIKAKYRDLTGKLLLGEVVDAFCGMVEEEILLHDSDAVPAQAMVYAENPASFYPIEKRLKREGYRTIAAFALDAVAQLSQRSAPDFLILQLHGDAGHVTAQVDQLIQSGVDPIKIPTFVLVSGCTAAELTAILDKGVRDLLSYDVNLDLLVSGMRQLQEEQQVGSTSRTLLAQKAMGGTHGRLSDMNLIDLLQALGPSRKTARIIVSSDDNPDNRLVIYLNEGRICHAHLGNLAGAEAVFEGLGWDHGSWWVQPTRSEELPEPNNDLPNESVLMEGCRHIDERARGQQAPHPA